MVSLAHFKIPLSANKMGVKRPADELDPPRSLSYRRSFKRTKISPAAPDIGNSSDPSSCSVSEDSALQSSPPISEHTRQSSMSSLQQPSDDDESISSVSTSSDESSVSDSDEDEIVTIGGPKKPEIAHTQLADGAQDMRARITSFLPQLAEANDLLTSGQDVQNIEDVDEDEQHIEMNLGLGVLEEQHDDSASGDSEERHSESDDEDVELPASSGTVKRVNESQKADVMGKLLGSRTGRRKVDIQDLG